MVESNLTELAPVLESITLPEEGADRMVAILGGVETSLSNGDSVELDIYLPQLELPTYWSHDDFISACVQILQVALEVDNEKGARQVLDHFGKYSFRYVTITITTEVYLWAPITIEILRLLARAYPLEVFEVHVLNLIDYGDSPDMTRACERLDAVFGMQEVGVYRGLADYAEENKRGMMANWLRLKQSQSDEVAPIPPWVRPFDPALPEKPRTTDPVPEPPEFRVQLPDPDKAASMMLEYSGIYNIVFPDYAAAYDAVKKKYEAASEEERKKQLADIFKYQYNSLLENDETYFKLLGPAHAITSFNTADINHPCLKYGGCRMFICQHHIQFEDPDEVGFPEDWFVGYCIYRKCERNIASRVHAIREPVRGGGWFGCFCSYEHLREFMSNADSGYQVDTYEYTVIEKVLDDLNRIGIPDRIEAGPIIPWVAEADYRKGRPENTPTIAQLLAGSKAVIETVPITLASINEDFAPPTGIVDTPSYCLDVTECSRPRP